MSSDEGCQDEKLTFHSSLSNLDEPKLGDRSFISAGKVFSHITVILC